MKIIETEKYLKKLELEEYPEPDLILLKYPVLLCHGYGAIASIVKASPMYEPCIILRKHGVIAFAPNIVPYAKIETRAKQWIEKINHLTENYGFEKLNVVGHSMAGLDLRYALHQTNIAEKVASLTTVATPHRGTSLAELVLNTPDKVTEKLAEFFDWFGNSMYPKSKSDAVGAVKQLTRDYILEDFNPANPDRDDLPYFSYSAAVGKGTDQPLNAIYRYQNSIIFDNEGPNDAFVSVESAKWGDHIETVNLSHLEQIQLQVSKERLPMVEDFWVGLAKMLAENKL